MVERTDNIVNPHPHEIDVWFEPWGMPHKLPPGQTFKVVTTSDEPGELEIDHSDDRIITVYAFPTATLKVFSNDDLVDDFNVKFPELPPNTTTKGFVDFFFGKPKS